MYKYLSLSNTEFLNFCAVNVWAGCVLVRGTVLCIVGYLAVALVSASWRSAVVPPAMTPKTSLDTGGGGATPPTRYHKSSTSILIYYVQQT